MPTELDTVIAATVEKLMANGGPLTVTNVEKFGQQLPMLAMAPPALPQFFQFFTNMYADKDFLIDGDIRLSFADVYAAARVAAGGLVEGHNVQVGDRIGIAARNSSNWIIAYMAVLMAGGVATLLNGWWQGGELADGVEDVGCTIVIADVQRAKRLESAGRDHGAKILDMGHDCLASEGLKSLNALGGGADTPLPELGGLENATILFTSGSTGKSKGAYSDHRGVTQAAMNYAASTLTLKTMMDDAGTPVPDTQPGTLLNVPLFHVTAEVPTVLQSFAIGRKLVLMPKWDAEEAMRLIEKERISYFVGVPLMSMELASHPKRGDYDLTSCVTFAAGGAPRPTEHVKRIKEEMDWGFPVLGYGLTETNGVGCGNFNENYLAKPTSTGAPTAPLVELGIIDDDGNEVPQGQVAEVCIRTICNFIGYWGNEEATNAAFTSDGWFRTGDLGYVDEDNYLFIVDRKKDIIIRGGENISCHEVEAAAYEHEQVAEACVFSVPHDRFGEVPAIVYYAKDGDATNPDVLREFLSSRLAAFKVPEHMWQSTDELPRLGTEKIDKVTLAKKYRDIVAAQG